MMKFNSFLKKALLVTAVAALSVVGIGAVKHVAAAGNCIPYDPNSHIKDPIFNHFCGVPNGVGDEPDFVRIRQSTNGNNEDNSGNPVYTGSSISVACNTGDKYDIWTYVHNNADGNAYNKNGNGPAVAHGVKLNLSAPGVGTTNNDFNFSSTVSASNAASVTDSVGLHCAGNVKLTLVPSVVHLYSQQYGWKTLPDSAVNSTFPIGSPNFGSGDQWGCWEYRIVVVYTVTVEKPPVVTPSYACTLLKLDIIDKTNRKVNATVTYTATNATFKSATFNWGDNSSNTVNGTTSSHQYSADNNYNVTATLKFDIGGTEVQHSCSAPLSFTTTPPPSTPPSTPPATTLPNTGPGSVAAIFTGVTAFAGMFHYLWNGRKQNQ